MSNRFGVSKSKKHRYQNMEKVKKKHLKKKSKEEELYNPENRLKKE
jgi:hypothetical protein